MINICRYDFGYGNLMNQAKRFFGNLRMPAAFLRKPLRSDC